MSQHVYSSSEVILLSHGMPTTHITSDRKYRAHSLALSCREKIKHITLSLSVECVLVLKMSRDNPAKPMMSQYWSSLMERRVNLFTLVVFLAHKVSYSCSPLLEELVELDRKQERKKFRCGGRGEAFFLDELREDVNTADESVWHYLLQPSELIRLIRRQHDAGNVFLISVLFQFLSLVYLVIKAVFQATVIGNDEAQAHYYSRSWFPRIWESFPHPENFYSLHILLCVYYITLRLLCIRRLIRTSVINRDGYKIINTTMTNLPVAASYNWPVKIWIKAVKKFFRHKRKCGEDIAVRRSHVSFAPKCEEIMNRHSKKELIYYRNVIDFSDCFGKETVNEMQQNLRSSWARNWFIAQPAPRVDPHELSLLIALQISGLSLLFSLTTLLVFLSTFYEISRLTPNPDEASIFDIISATPKFLTCMNSLMRQSDLILLILIQLPNHIDAAVIYWDLVVLISRTRKVCDALEEDLTYYVVKACEYRQLNFGHMLHGTQVSETDSDDIFSMTDENSNQYEFDNITYAEKKAMNETLEMHVRLARLLNHEFLDLKRSHTLYLNLLFVGSGFCIALCISLILVVKSKLMILILICLIASCAVPLVGIVLFCVLAEQTVSSGEASILLCSQYSDNDI